MGLFAVQCLIFSVSWAHILTSTSNQPAPGPSIVDVHRQRYLSLEKALWHVIDSGLEEAYVLQQIHSGHRTFLTDNYHEKNVYLSLFDPDHRKLFDAINRINVSVADTVRSYLHTSSRYYNERDSITIARLNQNLTYQMEQIFNASGESDFYRIVRNVSICVIPNT